MERSDIRDAPSPHFAEPVLGLAQGKTPGGSMRATALGTADQLFGERQQDLFGERMLIARCLL